MAAILLENFMHMALNECALGTRHDTEITHQARIGWRRLQSSLRFFKPLLKDFPPAPMAELKPLIQTTDQLRNLDVALDDTLPTWWAALPADPAMAPADWTDMIRALQDARTKALHAVKTKAHDPETTRMLLNMVHWIAQLSTQSHPKHLALDRKKFSQWLFKRLQSWHKKLKIGADSSDLARQHRLRILAKQQRYAIENLQARVPRTSAQRFHERAQKLQVDLGVQRDQYIALELITQLNRYPGMVALLQKQFLGPQAHTAQPAIGKPLK
ncbi:CHAD domain-containing protein [Limnohabitans sp. T6-5]|uniref:CHAD domain-containing protein n=1 Tax=Limnohabitans sp. T6-5 TaxID=1100724 RepID=UPI001304E95A